MLLGVLFFGIVLASAADAGRVFRLGIGATVFLIVCGATLLLRGKIPLWFLRKSAAMEVARAPLPLSDDEILFKRNTVEDIDGVSVAAGYVSEQEYWAADGTPRTGPAYNILFEDRARLKVGVGSRFMVHRSTWEVKESGPQFLRLVPVVASRPDAGALDWAYQEECPLCGRNAGWSGELEQDETGIGRVMRCPHCGNVSTWQRGVDQEGLKEAWQLKRVPACYPGRGLKREL